MTPQSDLRPTCDLGDCHGKPVGKRWSWSWTQYFHLCAKCLKRWDEIYGDRSRAIAPHEVQQ